MHENRNEKCCNVNFVGGISYTIERDETTSTFGTRLKPFIYMSNSLEQTDSDDNLTLSKLI